MDRITTTIKREWLARIIAGDKRVEYRQMTPYWRRRLAAASVPFELRLINGMQKRAPEVTVLVDRVRANSTWSCRSSRPRGQVYRGIEELPSL